MPKVSDVVQAILEHVSGANGDAHEDSTTVDESQAPDEVTEMFIELSLFPETHIVELCRVSGDRIKQQKIVQEAGGSASKVSRLLSDMEAEDHITRVNVGRENVVCLPDKLLTWRA